MWLQRLPPSDRYIRKTIEEKTMVRQEVARAICEQIRRENERSASSVQALQCRACEACSGGRVLKTGSGRACCQVSRRLVRHVALHI